MLLYFELLILKFRWNRCPWRWTQHVPLKWRCPHPRLQVIDLITN